MKERWKKLLEVYRHFGRHHADSFDWSEQSANEQVQYESTGTPLPSPRNGFAFGQSQATLTLKMWRDDIKAGLLFKFELLEDPALEPIRWWIENAIKSWPQGVIVEAA